MSITTLDPPVVAPGKLYEIGYLAPILSVRQ